jgi:hypothetical protein
MVLSTTKKASSIASITNQSTKGGNKKAGFAAMVGRSAAMSVALHQTSQNSTVLKAPESSDVCSSRPVGSLPGNWRKC